MDIDDMWDDEEDIEQFTIRGLEKLASPASVPGGYVLVPVEVTDAMLEAWKRELCVPVGSSPEAKARRAYRAMLAAAPTPPSTEDRKDAELWRDLVSHQKFNNVPAVGYAINQAKKRQAMQENKP